MKEELALAALRTSSRSFVSRVSFPSHAPVAFLFWGVHLLYRVRSGVVFGVYDLALPLLLFGPLFLKPRRRRILASAAAYFAVYYVAFLPLLGDITLRAHWWEVPALESAVFRGANPVVAVQAYRTLPLNVLFCVGYSLHIFNILMPLFVFIVRRSDDHADAFTSTFLACGYLGFLIYLVYPVVPPRLALAEVTAVTPPWASGAWETAGSWFRANPYAAMPSLHCAFPLLSYLYLKSIGSPWRWVFALMTVWLFVGTVYLGEHYVSDVIAAVPVAWAAVYLVRRVEQYRHERT